MLALARSSLASLRVRTFSSWQRKCPKFFKSSSICVVRNCRAQIEFVIAYRVRRGLQLLILYSRLGEQHTLWRCLQLFHRYFSHYSKAAAISLSAALIKFNWSVERIRDDEMTSHLDDIDVCHRLKNDSAGASNFPCDESMPVNPTPEAFLEFLWSESCWKPFVSMNNLTIWKKQTSEAQSDTLCCYKVYGYFEDVKALSFLKAYLDLETRKTWDQHVLKLEIVESEPETNSDLIYWVSKWPRLFSNRDYVYKRRFLVDNDKQLIAVVSKSATHPDYPPTKSNWRVQEYWSYLVVKPYTTFRDHGVEFSLTYYDDPGSNLPGSMLIWATVHGMPTYFKHLHEQTLKIERAGGTRLTDFKNNQPSQVEVDPYEGYLTEEGEDNLERRSDVGDEPKKTENPEKRVAVNVPFPLPPPSDPNKPPILPKELSHDELLRSWNEIKLKVRESVDKVAEDISEVTDPVRRSSEDAVQSSDNTSDKTCNDTKTDATSSEPTLPNETGMMKKTTSWVWDPFFGSYVVRAPECLNSSKGSHNESDLNGSQVLMICEQNFVFNTVMSLQRVMYKLLFDRIWR